MQALLQILNLAKRDAPEIPIAARGLGLVKDNLKRAITNTKNHQKEFVLMMRVDSVYMALIDTTAEEMYHRQQLQDRINLLPFPTGHQPPFLRLHMAVRAVHQA